MDQATRLFNLICSLSDLRLCVFVCVCYVCFNYFFFFFFLLGSYDLHLVETSLLS